ncbi:MAG: hypothetical protein AAFR46_07015 [Pseudomonadota bacterium]
MRAETEAAYYALLEQMQIAALLEGLSLDPADPPFESEDAAVLEAWRAAVARYGDMREAARVVGQTLAEVSGPEDLAQLRAIAGDALWQQAMAAELAIRRRDDEAVRAEGSALVAQYARTDPARLAALRAIEEARRAATLGLVVDNAMAFLRSAAAGDRYEIDPRLTQFPPLMAMQSRQHAYAVLAVSYRELSVDEIQRLGRMWREPVMQRLTAGIFWGMGAVYWGHIHKIADLLEEAATTDQP